MRTPNRALFTVFSCLLCAPGVSHAGPWIPDAGHGYLKLGVRWLPGSGYHAGDGTTRAYGAYHEVTIGTYVELGVGPHVSVWMQSPLVQRFSLSDPRTGASSVFVTPGDTTLGARVGITQNTPWVSSVGVFTRAPIADRNPVAVVYSTESGNPPIGALRIGSGVWDLAAEFSLGRSLGGNWYTTATVAGVWRSGGYDPAVQWSAELGNRFSARIAARVRLQGAHAIAVGDAPRSESPSGVGNGTSYTGFTVETEFRLLSWLDVGVAFQGGIAGIRRQTGGPVFDLYFASAF